MKREREKPTYIWQRDEWPRFVVRLDAVARPLARARAALGEVVGAARMLDPALANEAYAAILVEDSRTTSAIEGQTIDVAAVRSSVSRKLGIAQRGKGRTSREADALVELLIDATRNPASKLTIERLCGWQAALFVTGRSGLHEVRVGQLRGEAVMQVISGEASGEPVVHFEAVPGARLEGELAAFLAWLNDAPREMDGLVRASLAHLWFVTIHPFEDGNGRVARAVTDMALAQDEAVAMRVMSLSAQILREREAYYAMLETTQRGGLDVTDWVAWHLEQVALAALASREVVERTFVKARAFLRWREVAMNERQRKVLARMLDEGAEGFVGGMTTRKYMSLTRASRATAWRELHDLVEKGCLVATGAGGRNVAYRVAV